jgi:hypothetical protein
VETYRTRNKNYIILNLLILFELISTNAKSQILFTELFDDAAIASRGWYDYTSPVISTTEHIQGSTGSLELTWLAGQTIPIQGNAMRRLFTASEEIYLSYWVKYCSNYIGSGVAYHPHEIYILTNADGAYIGPAGTHLTTYIEHNAGHPRFALQDLLNVDTNCILLNNNNFVGCNGDFSTYQFTENRSVCSCNGLSGNLDGRDCFRAGTNPAQWYSARFWRNDTVSLLNNSWRHIQAHFKMNSIVGGIGITDGEMDYWLDGQLILHYDSILFRTGANANLRFNQLLIGAYIGVGSPIDQSFWIDDLTMSTQPIINNVEQLYLPELFSINQNPIQDQLELKITKQFNIKLFNVIGENILRRYVTESTSINISDLQNGIYFIEATTSSQREIKKIIVHH